MYELLDKPAAIREVQRFLHLISDSNDGKIPRISIDGIYGEETKDAVMAFQSLNNINATGIVDLITFDALYREYKFISDDKARDDRIITDEGFPIKLGSQSEDVLIINLMLSELGKTYTEIGYVEHSKYFSKNSQNATIELQKIFLYPQTGEIDAIFYERLGKELDALRRLNEIYN